jgi:hypothetical protein
LGRPTTETPLHPQVDRFIPATNANAMTPQNYKTAAIVCFVLCAIFIFVAIERSQANASSVEAINQLTGSALELRPATPTGAVYAWFFAILTGIGGAFCLSRAKPKS